MPKVKRKKGFDALIFIDTNIYLDFYRARDKSFELSMIKHIDKHHDSIITTDQVFMEYKKNRQKVILDTLVLIKYPEVNIVIPAFLSEASQVKMISKQKAELKRQIDKLKNRVKGALKSPVNKDPLYQCLQRHFKEDRQYHLGRKNKVRVDIRKLAWKRFWLGYPPRKESDTSYGDAINWEWIIYCANQSKKDIIIVSRDGDYGKIFDDEPILNDWLPHEFKDRISQQRKIMLTNKLSKAFQLINVPISKKEQKQEEELIQNLVLTESLNDKFYKIMFNNLSKGFFAKRTNDFINLLDDKNQNGTTSNVEKK